MQSTHNIDIRRCETHKDLINVFCMFAKIDQANPTPKIMLSLSRLRKFYENMKNLFLPPLNVPVCMHACVYDVRTSYIVWVCKCVSMKSQKQRDKRRNEDNLPFRWQHLTYNVLARTQTKTIIDIVHCCVWTSHIPCKQYRGESIETSLAMQQDDDTMNKRKSLWKCQNMVFS